jgi:hypothetical protein
LLEPGCDCGSVDALSKKFLKYIFYPRTILFVSIQKGKISKKAVSIFFRKEPFSKCFSLAWFNWNQQ